VSTALQADPGVTGGGLDVERLRADFPILAQQVHGKPLVYLDNGASTQKPNAVIDAIGDFYARDYANIHRGVHTLSERATAAFEGARDRVQRFLNAADRREIVYDRQALEAANTHDPYWNAAMAEMRDTGFMHSYMRMYWGKKIIEWSPTPMQAFETSLALNNRYFLDGRDPNSYAGVGWVFGLHDRAWFERGIFGKVRYMAASGLERKCDIRAYIEKVAAFSRRVGGR